MKVSPSLEDMSNIRPSKFDQYLETIALKIKIKCTKSCRHKAMKENNLSSFPETSPQYRNKTNESMIDTA